MCQLSFLSKSNSSVIETSTKNVMFRVEKEELYLQIDKENYTAWNKTEN
jgi:hypothetical protein